MILGEKTHKLSGKEEIIVTATNKEGHGDSLMGPWKDPSQVTSLKKVQVLSMLHVTTSVDKIVPFNGWDLNTCVCVCVWYTAKWF